MNNKRFLLFSALFAVFALALLAHPVATAHNSNQAATMASTMAASSTMSATAAPTSSIVFTPVATAALVNGNPQELHIYNYTTYIADDTISNFEKLYNVKVSYDTYETSDVMLAKIQAGNPGYDIIVPPDYDIPLLVKAGLLQPLDVSQLSNFTQNATKRFVNPPYDPGNKYSVAYQWGTIGIGFVPAATAKLGHAPTSWADLFDPKLKARAAVLNSPRETIAIMLNFLGKDPNSTKKADLDAVKAYLIAHKDVIARFHDSDGQISLAKGEVDAISDWSGDMFQVIADPANAKANLQYIIPKEGTVIWTDNMAIPKGAPNKDLAMKFINYIYDSRVAASISNYTGYGTPNQAAIDQKLIDAASLANPSIYPPADVEAKLFVLSDIGDAQTLYDQEWADIKAAVSQ